MQSNASRLPSGCPVVQVPFANIGKSFSAISLGFSRFLRGDCCGFSFLVVFLLDLYPTHDFIDDLFTGLSVWVKYTTDDFRVLWFIRSGQRIYCFCSC